MRSISRTRRSEAAVPQESPGTSSSPRKPSLGGTPKLRASPPIHPAPRRALDSDSTLEFSNVYADSPKKRTNFFPHTLSSFTFIIIAGFVGWKLVDYSNLFLVADDSSDGPGRATYSNSAAAPQLPGGSNARDDTTSPDPPRKQLQVQVAGGEKSAPSGSSSFLEASSPSATGETAPNVDTGFQSYFDDIAVVVVGGIGRQEHLAAAYSSWTSVFKNRILVTDALPTKHAGPPGMHDVLVNVYAGFASEADALREHTHPDHPIRKYLDHPEELANRKHFENGMDAATRELFSSKHTLGWHLGQGKYLLGMELAQAKFPEAKWYIIADSDTMVFPERLVAGLHLEGRSSKVPVAIGAVYGAAKSELLPKFTSFLGGAGVVVNQAAMTKMNLSTCVAEQVSNLGWSTAPADWRMGLCLNKYNVRKSNEKYMYQGNEQLNCLPHGGTPQECAWGGHYGNVMSDCPLTLHYQTPEHMQALFAARSSRDKGGVCVPAPHWRDFTRECVCSTPAEALENGRAQPPKKGDHLPRGKHPTIAQLVDSTISETVKARLKAGAAEQLKASAIKEKVEDIHMVMLFPQRKEIASVFATASTLFKEDPGTAASDPAAFRTAVIKALAANPKANVGRLQSWALKQI